MISLPRAAALSLSALMLSGIALTTSACAGPPPATRPSPRASAPAPFPDGELVVYTDGGEVKIAPPDGSDPVSLTDDIEGEALHPDWSPDGTAVVFAVHDSDGTRDIWVARSGETPARLIDCADPCVWTDDPAWSPDGSAIAFHRGTAGDSRGGIATLETFPLAGGTPAIVATTAAGTYPFSPRWAPDGSRLVVELITFSSEDIDEEGVDSTQLAIIDRTTGAIAELTPADWGAGTPDWDSDGSRILFVSAPDPTKPYTEISWIAPAGGAATPITDVAKDQHRAILGTWSPDATLVVFDEEIRLGDPSSAVISTVPADGGEVVAWFAGTHPRLRPVS